MVVPNSTGNNGSSRLRIVVALWYSLIMCLPWELWFGLDLDLGLSSICSEFWALLLYVIALTILKAGDEVFPVLYIPATWAMVVRPGMQTMSKSRYAKLGFESYRFLAAFAAHCSIKVGWIFTKLGTYIDEYAFKLSCNWCDVLLIMSAPHAITNGTVSNQRRNKDKFSQHYFWVYFTYLNASHYDILFSFTLFSSLNKCFIFCLVLLYSHCI